MQLLLQTVLSVEDTHEKAQCKNKHVKKQALEYWKYLVKAELFVPTYLLYNTLIPMKTNIH